jgi:hypothetical protein
MQQKEDNLFLQAKKTEKIKSVNIPVILQVIEKGLMLLGIKGEKHPDEISMKLIVAELRSHYVNLTIGELDLSFTLASRGQLDYDNETYQSFSVLYLNRMLSAYLRWAANKHFIENVREPITPALPLPEDDVIATAFDSYKKFKQWWSIFNCLKTFNILHKRGEVGQDIDYIVKSTEEAMQRRIDRADSEDKKDLIAELKDDDIMELNCRRMAVALYFNKKINELTT